MNWIDAHWREKSGEKQGNSHANHKNHLVHMEDQIKINQFKLN
jgi:hypothetical protein